MTYYSDYHACGIHTVYYSYKKAYYIYMYMYMYSRAHDQRERELAELSTFLGSPSLPVLDEMTTKKLRKVTFFICVVSCPVLHHVAQYRIVVNYTIITTFFKFLFMEGMG